MIIMLFPPFVVRWLYVTNLTFISLEILHIRPLKDGTAGFLFKDYFLWLVLFISWNRKLKSIVYYGQAFPTLNWYLY